jgi:hypothetical protein
LYRMANKLFLIVVLFIRSFSSIQKFPFLSMLIKGKVS